LLGEVVRKMSENIEKISGVIEALAGKGSDLVLTFEDLTLAVIGGEEEKPRVKLKLSGGIRLDVVYVKE
jgi:hypothetical protein